MEDIPISSLDDLTRRVSADSRGWHYRWFRGEPLDTCKPLTPTLYREKTRYDLHHNENRLLQHFRMKAPSFAHGYTPDREATDQWLFLAQHMGLPTRLLDWTESVLVALFFAIHKERPAVIWMLNPIALNNLSIDATHVAAGVADFPLTWIRGHEDEAGRLVDVNIGNINIRGAWEEDGPGVNRPVAVLPAYVHPRLSVQRSCFTVHGKDKRSLKDQVETTILKRYRMSSEKDERMAMQDELRMLGIDYSTVYPDLQGLASELRERF